MLGLIDIKYGQDTNGNPLSFCINLSSVGSSFTGPTGFYVYLNAINTSASQPTFSNFSTKLSFHAPNQPIAQAMGEAWLSATNSLVLEPQVVSLDFFSQGCTFEQTIVGSL